MATDWARAAYGFELPPELIAQTPAERRDDARMLVVQRPPGGRPGAAPTLLDARIAELPAHLTRRDMLVLNDSAVLPARLYARRQGGARVEVLLLSLSHDRATALLRANRRLPDGDVLIVATDDGDAKVVVGPPVSADGVRELSVPDGWLTPARLRALGVPPLPPYIRRDPTNARLAALDRERYQTVYAAVPDDGHFSVAAPTAGLHFTPALLEACTGACAGVATLTLHVGLGTFRPVRADDVREHTMHAERFRLRADVLNTLRAHREAGGRLVAVGTTSARVLETLARLGHLPANDAALADQPSLRVPAAVETSPDGVSGETALFLHPPHAPVGFDGILTNFHLPESTLIMLVASVLGREATLAAYRHAVASGYRFFSYGDAMYIPPV